MLVLFLGTIDVSSGVAVDRKVTFMARTLSDLTSRATSVDDNDLNNFFAASTAIMTPYSAVGLPDVITDANFIAVFERWAHQQKGRANGTAFRFRSFNFAKISAVPAHAEACQVTQPAARRLSAEDLPERRSATIS
jgi:Flp pilus assembly protein TadG